MNTRRYHLFVKACCWEAMGEDARERTWTTLYTAARADHPGLTDEACHRVETQTPAGHPATDPQRCLTLIVAG